ncbi:MAG TPA: hypothetical protein VIV66_03260 [Pyrinomonadaceae bacterium]
MTPESFINFSLLYLIITGVMAVVVVFAIRSFVRARLRYGGAQRIICPETGKTAMVEVDAVRAALTSTIGRPDIRVESCWRWPLKENCGQECLTQLNGAPPYSLVRGVLSKWYRSKFCAYCGKQFSEINWTDHKPAVETADGPLLEWKDVPVKDFERTLSTYVPVCCDCYIAQSFVRNHEDLVVYRPWRSIVSDM